MREISEPIVRKLLHKCKDGKESIGTKAQYEEIQYGDSDSVSMGLECLDCGHQFDPDDMVVIMEDIYLDQIE